MKNNYNWLYMSLEELIDLDVDKKGEIYNDSTNYDKVRNGDTESGA